MDNLFICPYCSSDLHSNHVSCSKCSFQGNVRDEILSFIEPSENMNGRLEPAERVELADLVEDTTIYEGVMEFLAGHSTHSEIASEVFDVRREDWRVLVADDLSGRCLDMRAGYGRRAMLLAELVDEVYAVDSSIAKLRILAARDDYDSADRVVPVHTRIDRLPFPTQAFDTIICDLTAFEITGIERSVQILSRYLDTDGSLLVTVDGWPRQSGLLDRLGLDSTPIERHRISLSTPAQIQSAFSNDEFESFSSLALVPTTQKLRYCLDIDDEVALRGLLRTLNLKSAKGGEILETAAGISNRLGLLKRSFPSYLIVGRKGSTTPADDRFQFQHPILVSGRARAVILDQNEKGLTAVYKVPNRAAHESITAHETALLAQLRASEAPITRTLPRGTAVQSRFGTVRKEVPVTGQSLNKQLTDDLYSFERILDTGFEWLIDFQENYRTNKVNHSSKTIRENLTVDHLDLIPPDNIEPVELFETAVHGDFLPQNIYADSGSVSSVIDWELGALSGNPIVDPSFFVLKTTMMITEDFSDALHEIFIKDSAISQIIWEYITSYCNQAGISTQAFITYFPYVYIRRITNEKYNIVTDHLVNDTFDRWSEYISQIWALSAKHDLMP